MTAFDFLAPAPDCPLPAPIETFNTSVLSVGSRRSTANRITVNSSQCDETCVDLATHEIPIDHHFLYTLPRRKNSLRYRKNSLPVEN